mgnify:FL=1
MTTPTDQFQVSYLSGNKTAEEFPIPFVFRVNTIIQVISYTIPGVLPAVSESHTLGVDYTLVYGDSDGTKTVIGDGIFAEFGTIVWIGASPANRVILIQRVETFQQTNAFADDAAVDTLALEQQMDRLTQASHGRMTRSAGDPSTFDAKGMRIVDSAAPIDSTDAVTKGAVDAMTTVGVLPDSDTIGKWFSVSSGAAGWEVKNTLPSVSLGQKFSLLRQTSGNPVPHADADDWAAYPTVTTPRTFLTGSTSYSASTDINETRWEPFREVPLSDVTGVSNDDVVTVLNGGAMSWRDTREFPDPEGKDQQFAEWSSGGPAWGHHMTWGKATKSGHTVAKFTGNEADLVHTEGTMQFTLTVTHGLKDDAGSSVEPDFVLLQPGIGIPPGGSNVGHWSTWIPVVSDKDSTEFTLTAYLWQIEKGAPGDYGDAAPTGGNQPVGNMFFTGISGATNIDFYWMAVKL